MTITKEQKSELLLLIDNVSRAYKKWGECDGHSEERFAMKMESKLLSYIEELTDE